MWAHSRQAPHAYAVDRAGSDAQLATGALGLDYRVHKLLRTNNGIDGTRASAVGATDAKSFINDGNTATRSGLFNKRQYVFAQQAGEALNGIVAARRTKIDCNVGLDDGRRVRPATRIATLRALGLWQQFIDLLDELVGIGR